MTETNKPMPLEQYLLFVKLQRLLDDYCGEHGFLKLTHPKLQELTTHILHELIPERPP